MSTTTTPTRLKLHDLTAAARAGHLDAEPVGRVRELQRLVRTLSRPQHHHALLVGPPGVGKTTLTQALALQLVHGHHRPLPSQTYRLHTSPLQRLLASGADFTPALEALHQAAAKLPPAIIIIEDLQLLIADDPVRQELTLQLLETLAAHPTLRLIATISTPAYYNHLQNDYIAARLLEAIELTPPSTQDATAMVEYAAALLERHYHQTITLDAVTSAVEYGQRYGHGRALPDAALRLLDQACAAASTGDDIHIQARHVQSIVTERERVPLASLHQTQNQTLTNLLPTLTSAVVGQEPALKTIAATIARAQLGLGDPTRPRGSFLALGPSGVGKTETAKTLATAVFHNPSAFIRLDMSEYSQSHTAVRLIGSPPGYVGYEEGGQLTGAVAREPYSLILLDEIEKAHPQVFDTFLQLLDDGRLTDSSGQTVDFTDTIILATSNTAATQIARDAADGHNVHSDDYLHRVLLPQLTRHFRPEFLNRFDAILVYQPLTLQHLVDLAQRELRRLERQLSHLNVNFNVSNQHLAHLLHPTANPLLGARPVKRLIARHFEAPIANLLMNGQLPTPITITGEEPWLNND